MKKILVPIDYSATAKNAANYAIELAKQIKAEITLLHIFDMPIAVTDTPMALIPYGDLEKINSEMIKKYEKELTTKYGNDITISSIVKMGFVFDEIKNTVEEKKIDLVVMGITGAGKLSELLIGSNATRVVKKLNCPTIVVPEGATFNQIKNIAFACDYNQIEESKAVDTLVEFVKLFGAKLMVINIGEHREHHTYSKELAGKLLEYIFENVNETLDIPSNIDYSIHKRKDEDVIHGINRFIEKHKADLLVMIPRKHSLLSGLFHESNTKKNGISYSYSFVSAS